MPAELADKVGDRGWADALLAGIVDLGNTKSSLPRDLLWSRTETKVGARGLAELHALEWIDPLRRVAQDVDCAEAKLWGHLIATWVTHADAERSGPAWYSKTLARRLRVLALGAPFAAECAWFRASINVHVDRVQAWLAIPAAHASWESMVDSVWLLQRQELVSRQSLDQVLREWLSGLVDDQGWMLGNDVMSAEARRSAVLNKLAVLEQEGVDVDDARARVTNRKFAGHVVKPSGAFMDLGGRAVSDDFQHDDSEVQFSRSHGAAGEAPGAFSMVARNGLATMRSGFGENERNSDRETFVSMAFGTVARADGHVDAGRVTYVADGVEWLVDPPDDGVAALDWHSVMTVAGRKPVVGGSHVALAGHHHGDQEELVVLRSNIYRPLKHRRSLAWSVAGEYIVVDDHVTGGDAVVEQRWIIHPDIDVHLGDDHIGDETSTLTVWLQRGDAHCAMHAIGIDANGVQLERGPHAQRLIFRASSGGRLSTWLGRVLRPDEHEVNLECTSWGLLVRTTERSYSEALAIGDSRAAVMPVTAETDEARSRLVVSEGTEFPFESQAEARDKVASVKERVWRAGGAREVRESAIDELKRFAADSGLLRSAHHGVGAALVDLAGNDLQDRLKHGCPAGIGQRMPVVNWLSEVMRHPFYDVPVVTEREVKATETEESSFIHSIDLGPLVLPVHVTGEPGPNLVALFQGALDRTKIRTPYFGMLGRFKRLPPGPKLVFSDPMFDLDSGMRLSWYLGTSDLDLHRIMAELISAYALKHSANNLVLAGSSGGGFTALQVGAHLPDARVVAASPQITLAKYSPGVVAKAAAHAFGDQGLPIEGEWAKRMDVIARYREIDFARDVVYLQNEGDHSHIQKHYRPFVQAFRDSPSSERLTVRLTKDGPGHRAVNPDRLVSVITEQFG